MPRTDSGSAVTIVTDATFDHAVLQHPRPVLVDFWAEWCPPCHMLAPVLEAVARERADSLTVATINNDENPTTAARYRVLSLPTLMVFRDGQITIAVVGARPKARLLAEIDEALRPTAPGLAQTPGPRG